MCQSLHVEGFSWLLLHAYLVIFISSSSVIVTLTMISPLVQFENDGENDIVGGITVLYSVMLTTAEKYVLFSII